MKLKSILATAVGLFLAAGCAQEYEVSHLSEIQLSETFISIAPEGGSTTVKLSATVDWAFEKNIETTKNLYVDGKPVFEDHKNVKVYVETPDWLKVNTLNGKAGEDVDLVFTAEGNDGVGRETNLVIKAGDKLQNLTVRQGEIQASEATVKQVIEGKNGQTFVVTGTCTRITSTTYGNWYLKDDSTDEELYIYGTVDDTGNYNWDSFNIEVGDKVTIRGSRTEYNGVIEFEKARFVDIEKSLIQGFAPRVLVPAAGGEVKAKFIVKGGSMNYDFPDGLDWATIKGIETIKASDPDSGDPDTTAVVFNVDPMSDRMSKRESQYITFKSLNAKGNSEYTMCLVQYPDATSAISDVFDKIGSENQPVTVEGVIAATCSNGFLLSKDDDLIFVSASDYYDDFKEKKGYSVMLSGEVGKDNDGAQISSLEFLEIGEKGNYADPAEPVTLDAEAIDAVNVGDDGLYDVVYFTATGSLSDPYHNLSIAGADTQLAFTGTDSDIFDLNAYCDYCNKGETPRTITVTGYYISKQSTRINFIVTDIKPELEEE